MPVCRSPRNLDSLVIPVILCASLHVACVLQNANCNEPAFGIETRQSWTNTRLLGFPEPPPPYQVEQIYTKLSTKKPIAVGSFPDGKLMWIVSHEKEYDGVGQIHQFVDEQGAEKKELFLERPEIIYGLAFHPRFFENGYLYLGCNGKSEKLGDVATRVIRVTLEKQPPFKCDSSSAVVIIEWLSNGHNGGDLAFGLDGMLYVSAGDGTSDSDTNLTAQDLSSINGSMIRIDVDHAEGEQLYRVPPDNPFIDTPGAKPEIWAYGLRNPWRVTVDKQTGHLWVGNNGQDLWETAHLIRRGENYGWSVMEGSHPFQIERKRGPTPVVAPTIEHHHSEARSLTGGIVYYGDRLPQLKGAYIYGDYSTGTIWAVKHDGQRITWHERLARSSLQISGFGVDTSGELIVVDHGSGLYRLSPHAEPVSEVPFPHSLSETGLFSTISDAQPHAGLISYSVNSPLWSDGAAKDRYMAIPDAEQIEFTEKGGWNFPDKSVLVKTFSLPIRDGTQTVRRRIETRLMVKSGKEWFGYSYAWNDEQTDAVLVPPQGADETFQVDSASALLSRSERATTTRSERATTQPQIWRFPSRSECMVCHSRAANYVLGLNAAQMNTLHDYGGVADNQLRTLAHIGVLRIAKAKPDDPNSENSTAVGNELPKSANEYNRLANPADANEPLEARVRAYLEANCAHCHTNAGGGNSRIELTFGTSRDKMLVIDSIPQHDRFGIEDPRIVASGSPDRSLLLHRMAKRSAGQMPPLASSVVDQEGVALLREWIEQLEPK